jgi:hypothetical protein
MRKPTASPSTTPADPAGTEPLFAWLSERFEALRSEGQVVVDDYWRRMRAGRSGRTGSRRVSLGVRLRSRENGAFSLEWYEMGVLGQTRKPIAKRYIAKGRSHRYSLRSLLRGQPEWLAGLVEETEDVLADLRKRQMLLMKIRDAVVAYVGEEQGKALSGTELLGAYRQGLRDSGGATTKA